MNKEIIKTELNYKAVRSSGAGGQNVNKVSTKIQITFALETSNGLMDEEKITLTEKLSNRITKDNFIIIECDETRSQLKNKELAVKRLFILLENALKKEKKRLVTKVPKRVIRKRLEDKKNQAEKKLNRKFKL
ncbi:ribosome-associated protein [Algoriella xinjiangensis]|uniref:Ribosome-associated protein n=1 Tax=Algoriella xinjiangensis TaxID=684065 RepID=A0A1I4UX15_9FLAO|nr:MULTISPECIES: alternative ribosome rescue aminoacyl-tRNA hydrolase ArfB [Algoriella]MBO6212436.1 aminoacyl-tRNA hydrolase [Algoriella sp.]SFM93466.1 ribosome-associated protein [Algoriella xinjiangensis]VDH18119.1 Peptidyl-tRNA hydrolase YaeJ [Algoriella xinjiangensis]